MSWMSAMLLTAAQLAAAEPIPAPTHALPPANAPAAVMAEPIPAGEPGMLTAECCNTTCCDSGRGLFESDHAFDGFIGPISNPVYAKDPRALTEARLLFVNNQIDPAHPLGSGSLQAYGLQLCLALTDRLSFIADKDGYASISPGVGPNRTGWLNVAAGLKYAFIRDVEKQRLLTGGFMYEMPTGEAEVFQGHGDGIFTIFSTFGQEFGCHNHFVANLGYNFPLNQDLNSSFIYFSTTSTDRSWAGCTRCSRSTGTTTLQAATVACRRPWVKATA